MNNIANCFERSVGYRAVTAPSKHCASHSSPRWLFGILSLVLIVSSLFYSTASAKWGLFRSSATAVANTTSVVACGCYVWQGQTYTTTGYYTAHLTGSNGLDSVVAINLFVNQPTSSIVSQTACDSYTWYGTVYTASGTYTRSFINSMGCDSVITLNLTIVPTTTNTTQITACGSYTWAENGMTYSASGIYTSTTGCQQKVLELTIIPLTSTTTTVAACTSYTWAVNGQVYTTSGTYSYQSGCSTQYLNLTINPLPVSPTVSTTQPTCTSATGTATITAPTGTGFTYSLNNGPWQSSAVFSGLSSGSYSFTAKNANGCVSPASTATILPQPSSPTAPLVTLTQPTCTTASGSITVTSPIGSVYSYSINGTTYQSSPVFSGVIPGTYNVRVKNDAGCVSPATGAIINAAPTTPSTPTVSLTQPTCSVPTGSINVTSPLGTGFTYAINGGVYQSSTMFSGLVPGTYTVTAKNSSGCVSSPTAATVTTGTSLPAPTVSVTQPTCTTVTGTITVTAPTTSGLKFSINGSFYQSSRTFSGLVPGSYNVTCRSNSGCISPITIAVVNPVPPVPVAPVLTLTQPNCGSTVGSIQVTSPIGTGLQYSINGTTYQTATLFSGIAIGSYQVTVRNSFGCTGPATSATLTAPLVPSTPVLAVTQPTCTAPKGTITVTSPVGAAYAYSINGGAYQSGNIFNNLLPGSYQVRVISSSLCTSSVVTATVNQVPGCSAGIYQPTINCSAFNAGASPLSQICYTVNRGKFASVTPSTFVYYHYFTAPSASFTIDVAQVAQTVGFIPFTITQNANIDLWDANCVNIATGTQPAAGQARIAVTNAIAGASYIVSVTYDSRNIIGTTAPSGSPTAAYSFSTLINSTALANSSASILMKGSSCVVQKEINGTTFAAYPIVAYPNPTSGSVKLSYEMGEAGMVDVRVFDMTGRTVLKRNINHEQGGQYQLELPLRDEGLSPGLYLVNVSRNELVDEIRVILQY